MSTVTIASLAESLSAFLNANDFSAIAVLVDDHTFRFCYPELKPRLKH